jgi:putative pyruvate formate lyase activating enzyme
MQKVCGLCPRNCNINRFGGEIGFCGVGEHLKVARAALHFWEEPCISGDAGSGTVFFSGCSLRCVFCQNQNISRGKSGKVISVRRLAEIFLEQQTRGALNINLVTPSHYTEMIAEALQKAKISGLKIPVVWNSSGYEKSDTLRLLEGLVDIYMPDFKYMHPQTADRYSAAADYFTVAANALAEMYRQQPKVVFDADGIMQRGCLIRHLLLPGCVEESKQLIRYLFDKYSHHVYFSLMAQYTPCGDLAAYPEINRKVLQSEYDELVDFAMELGIENAYIQGSESASESFIPEFDCRGV